jgi:hypothetical protein
MVRRMIGRRMSRKVRREEEKHKGEQQTLLTII